MKYKSQCYAWLLSWRPQDNTDDYYHCSLSSKTTWQDCTAEDTILNVGPTGTFSLLSSVLQALCRPPQRTGISGLQYWFPHAQYSSARWVTPTGTMVACYGNISARCNWLLSNWISGLFHSGECAWYCTPDQRPWLRKAHVLGLRGGGVDLLLFFAKLHVIKLSSKYLCLQPWICTALDLSQGIVSAMGSCQYKSGQRPRLVWAHEWDNLWTTHPATIATQGSEYMVEKGLETK